MKHKPQVNEKEVIERPLFRDELRALINRYNMEAGSNTPDYILADFLCECFHSFNQATRLRTERMN